MNSLVQSLHIYPIKSTKGKAISESEVVDYGLLHDRVLAFVNYQNQVLTARENPNLLKLNCWMENETIYMVHPSIDEISISLKKARKSEADIKLFKDDYKGRIVYSEHIDKISKILGESVHLVQLNPNHSRKVKEKHGGRESDVLSLSDAGPILLLSEESLADLNSRLNDPIIMERFRPNIVISGLKPYQEDTWKHIRIGACEFKVAKACKRCVFTTIDPITLIKDKNQEPLKTLTTYRQSDTGGVTFGMYLIPRSAGRIKVGDDVEILD